jgi:hypothetical protein
MEIAGSDFHRDGNRCQRFPSQLEVATGEAGAMDQSGQSTISSYEK